MKHQDSLSEAMEDFINRLPNPRHSDISTIESEVVVDGKNIKFIAQKTKTRNGITWKVYPRDARLNVH